MRRSLPVSVVLVTFLFAALLGAAGPARGFTPAEQNSQYEIPMRQFDLAGYRPQAIEQDRLRLRRRRSGPWS